MLHKACLEVSVLAFLLETDASKLGLGVVLSQKQPDDWYHPVAYVSWSLTIHEHNYHSTKQEVLALKWAIAEQFQEYLHWKPFVVKTDNNPLTYILTTPNLDTTLDITIGTIGQTDAHDLVVAEANERIHE